MNNKKPIEIIKNYNLKPLSIYEKDGGFGMTIQENIISQIVEARDEECYNFLIKQIQNFIVKNNIETCFVINKEEMVDCLQEHNKLHCEIKNLQHQLDQQKAMWNELKVFINKRSLGYSYKLEHIGFNDKSSKFLFARYNFCSEIKNKIEECWVIQRDDGMYVNLEDNDDLTWYKKAWQASMTQSKSGAEHEIAIWQLQNCRPVKVELRVVGE